MSNAIRQRQAVERQILTAVVEDARKAGFTFTLDNGAGREETEYLTAESIIEAMCASDEDRLYFMRDNDIAGWVYFVYGNGGWDVINDYTTNLEAVLTRANKLADSLS